jgi:hypothetical protein
MSPWNRGAEKVPIIPKKTSPLTKAVRTGEFILTVIANVVIAVYSAIKPHVLPPSTAAGIIGGTTGGITLQRTILKGLAILKGVEPSIGTISSVLTRDLEPALGMVSPSLEARVAAEVPRVAAEVHRLISTATAEAGKLGGVSSIEHEAAAVEAAFQTIGEPALGPDTTTEAQVPVADPPIDPGLLVQPAAGVFASTGAGAPESAAASTIL